MKVIEALANLPLILLSEYLANFEDFVFLLSEILQEKFVYYKANGVNALELYCIVYMSFVKYFVHNPTL